MMMVGHWLVQEGIYRDMIGAVVGVIVTTIAAWRPFSRLQKSNREQVQMLDTSTPGGLTEILNAIRAAQKPGKGDDGGT